MDVEDLEEAHTHAEAVIRTALLALATRRTAMPDWAEFEKMVKGLRTKYRAARGRTAAQADKPRKASARSQTLSLNIPAGLPDEFRNVVQDVLQSVLDDVPQILDSALPARALFANDSDEHHAPLLGRYFWVEDIASEMAHHERAVSQAWDKATAGNCDDGSLLTLFVCVASGTAPRTLLSEKAAAALVRRIQKPGARTGFDPDLARQYIRDHAPAGQQDDYLGLWDAFVEEARPTLQSDSAYALNDALALLRRECHVVAP
jgi:hypothetical protein